MSGHPADIVRPARSLERSTGWRVSANRYVSVLFDTFFVTAWALWAFRDRSTDDVAACTLVVMISILVWLEVLIRGLVPPLNKWVKQQRAITLRPEQSVSRPVKVVASIVLVALVLFLVCEVYGVAFVIAAAALRMTLTWAVEKTLRAGVALLITGLLMLLLLVLTLVAATLAAIPWSELLSRITRTRFWIPGGLGEAIKSH